MRRSLATRRAARRAPGLGLALGLVLWLAAPPSGAQTADLNALSLEWARGRYLSPVICEIDGELVRGGRRLTILPGPRHARPRVDAVLFADLDVPGATRCFDDLGGTQPNVRGRLHFRLPGHSRPDSASRDFDAALRRSQGFEFHVSDGTLRIQEVGAGESRDVDFQGGTASLKIVQETSDDARVLSDLEGLRKLVLEIAAEDGTRLRFPLVMTRTR